MGFKHLFLISIMWIKTGYGRDPYNDRMVANLLQSLLAKPYDPRLRPNYLGPPVIVKIDATVMSVTKLDAINMMFTLDMFFRQTWHDDRLVHNLSKPLTLVAGTSHPADILWVPDTVFINSVTSNMHAVTVNNHKIDIHPDGTVFLGTRITVSPSCQMDLRAYPMDTQTCHIEIVSYAHGSDHIDYHWKHDTPLIVMDDKMAQFELVTFWAKREEIQYVAGSYTVLTGSFKFNRLMSFAVLQVYVPCVAIVIVSWVSFWIDSASAAARIGLCITTLLTISTIWSAVNAQLPRVNYVKAIDLYLMTSFCFVLCALLEFTLVVNAGNIVKCICDRRKKKKKKESSSRLRSVSEAKESFDGEPLLRSSFSSTIHSRRGSSWSSFHTTGLSCATYVNERGEQVICMDDMNPGKLPYDAQFTVPTQQRLSSVKEQEPELQPQVAGGTQTVDAAAPPWTAEDVAELVDRISRVLFPAIYTLFNIAYWMTYVK